MSLCAGRTFVDMLRLKAEVSELVGSIKALSQQRDRIRREVGKLDMAHRKLGGIERELEDSTGALRTHLSSLVTWQGELDEAMDGLKGDTTKINQEFEQAILQYHHMLEVNERALLDKAYQHIEGSDGIKGLSENEFSDLLFSLPTRYKLRFENIGLKFEDFAGDDGIIDHNEFKRFMDKMVQQESAANVEKFRNKSSQIQRQEEQEFKREEDL